METLRVGVLPLGGLFETRISENGEVEVVDGIEAQFVSMLSQGLGMKFKYSIPKDYKWGEFVNGSWTGLVGMVQRDEADMSLAKISLGLARSLAVGYSYPYSVDELTFATRLPGTLPNAAAFVNPFSTLLWICFFVMLIISPPIMRLLLSEKYPLEIVFLNLFGSLLNVSLSFKLKCLSDRLLAIFWMFGAMFISLCYTALLLSFMTVPVRERGIRNIPELAKIASTRSYKCAALLGSGSIEFLLFSDEPGTRSIGKNLEKNDITLFPERSPTLKVMYSEKLALVASRYDLQYLLNPYVYIAPDTFIILPASIMLNKNFKHTRKLNSVILRITAGGLYQKTVRDYMFQQQLESEKFQMESVEGPQPLHVYDLYGSFALLACGDILSIFAFVGELVVWKWKKTPKRVRRSRRM